MRKGWWSRCIQDLISLSCLTVTLWYKITYLIKPCALNKLLLDWSLRDNHLLKQPATSSTIQSWFTTKKHASFPFHTHPTLQMPDDGGLSHSLPLGFEVSQIYWWVHSPSILPILFCKALIHLLALVVPPLIHIHPLDRLTTSHMQNQWLLPVPQSFVVNDRLCL